MTLYRRIQDTDEETFGDDLVVMNAKTQAVVTLNGTARVVWESLAAPVTADDLVALFVAAFPETDAAMLERDVEAALATLIEAGLVVIDGGDDDGRR